MSVIFGGKQQGRGIQLDVSVGHFELSHGWRVPEKPLYGGGCDSISGPPDRVTTHAHDL
jgi:hypothetical protein